MEQEKIFANTLNMLHISDTELVSRIHKDLSNSTSKKQSNNNKMSKRFEQILLKVDMQIAISTQKVVFRGEGIVLYSDHSGIYVNLYVH